MRPETTEERLLLLLKKTASDYVSGEELSAKLHITRTAVWKHIQSLKYIGYEISAIPHLGYRLIAQPDRLLALEINYHRRSSVIGKRILSYETIDSTNRVALELGQQGQAEGLAVIAEEQSNGRGRLGRSWSSPKGQGLYVSFLVRPKMEIKEIPKITLTAAVSVATLLTEELGLKAQIKWPNDILIDKRKICGILTEMSAESDRISYVVVGIGLNINTKIALLPKGSTSIKEETGKTWDRCLIAAKLFNRFEIYYNKLTHGHFKDVAALWESLSAVSGHRIVAKSFTERFEGNAMGIDEDGALWIRRPTGIQTKLLSGDIVKIYDDYE